MHRTFLRVVIHVPLLLWGVVTAAEGAIKPGDSLIVVFPAELKCPKDTTSLTMGTKLEVMPGASPGREQEYLVTLVAIGRVGYVDRTAVIPQSEAIAHFTTAIEKNPRDAAAILARGKVWFHQRDKDKALADLDAGLQISPESNAYTIRAWIWKQQGNADKAIADFDAAIRLNPRETLAWRVRGATWANKDNYAKALEDFNEAIRVDPYNVDAYNHRASFLAGSKFPAYLNGTQALADATRACELTDWKASRYIQTLAAAYSELGDFDAALKWNAKALEMVPADQQKFLAELQSQYEKKQPYRRSW